MRTEAIEADSIDAAVERILEELSSRNNVIYFDGWDGLGASAVLRAVAQRLAAASSSLVAGVQQQQRFDQIVHVDCSNWESRRALQRAIAKQLELPAPMMEKFDKQDEEDDFHGVAQGSRAEIRQVSTEIYLLIQKLNQRLLVIFENGSNEEINLESFCGLPLSGFSTNKVLWTFQGRFRLYPKTKVDRAMERTGKTDVFLSASHGLEKREELRQELWSVLVHQEAAEVARKVVDTGGIIDDQTALVAAECFLYMSRLCCMGHHFMMDHDLATHGRNYWVCDGVIQQQGDARVTDDGEGSWLAAEALHREMLLDVDYYYLQHLPAHLGSCAQSVARMPHWSSPAYGFLLVPVGATPHGATLQHFDKLGALKLSRCTFSLSSPPFLCCHNLRFLWLDHCKDNQVIGKDGAAAVKEEDIRWCFQRLWVLDVRYTSCDGILSAPMMDLMTELRELNVMGAQDWDMGQLHGRLTNIRKLRVTKSTIHCSSCSSENDLFSGMNKMELLDFSGNRTMRGMSSLYGVSSRLETVTIDSCVGMQRISFMGCASLKNLFFRGLFEDLCILDLSGTAVKTLDLSAMAARNLDELFLHGCGKLCAILWRDEDKRKEYLKKLRIDTTQPSSSSSSLSVVHGGQAPSEFNWYISVRDARLLQSLVPVKSYFDDHWVDVEIFSATDAFGAGKDGDDEASNSSSNVVKQQILEHPPQSKTNAMYADVTVSLFKEHQLLQASQADGDAPALTRIWPCPQVPSYLTSTSDCYMHVQDRRLRRTKSLQLQELGEETTTSITIPDFICNHTRILHVHDSMSITSIPGPATVLDDRWWYFLNWCRVERCPKLEHVFFITPQLQASSGDLEIFKLLETFWASQLPKARFIWNWSRPSSELRLRPASFEDLNTLHLDFCPRVIHVLPLPLPMVYRSLGWLETLEIVWCGDLKEVFPLDTDSQQQQQSTVTFERLKCIHLRELPQLQGICGRWRMSAPRLEKVKIRGCWSLKRLPAVRSSWWRGGKVECECEKEWWDRLEWDGVEEHSSSLYAPTHSRYYKKTTLLRGTVLR